MKYYFTYGTEGHPYYGGWTEVEAPNWDAAVAAFRVYHPDKLKGIVNCAFIYDEPHFMVTRMFREGSFGHRCYERITLMREPFDDSEVR